MDLVGQPREGGPPSVVLNHLVQPPGVRYLAPAVPLQRDQDAGVAGENGPADRGQRGGQLLGQNLHPPLLQSLQSRGALGGGSAAKSFQHGRVEVVLVLPAAHHPIQESPLVSAENMRESEVDIRPALIVLIGKTRNRGAMSSGVAGAPRPEIDVLAIPFAGERIAEVLRRRRVLIVQPAQRVDDRDPVVKPAVGVGPILADVVTARKKLVAVLLQEVVEIGEVRRLVAVLMLGDQPRFLGIEPAEVEKTEGPAVDGVSGRPLLNVAVAQVPVGDVVTGVPVDRHAFEQAGRQIHPALVHEKPAARIDPALIVEAALPPAQETKSRQAPPEGDEAEIVGSRLQDLPLARRRLILQAGGKVRSEHHRRPFLQPRQERRQAIVEANIRIEVNQAAEAVPLEQQLAGVGLDGRAQLQYRVLEVEPLGIGNIQFFRENDLKVFLVRIEATVDAVHQHHKAKPLRMPAFDGRHQGSGRGQVVLGYDGEYPWLTRHGAKLWAETLC